MMSTEDKKIFDKWFEDQYATFQKYPTRLVLSVIEIATQVLHEKLDEEAKKNGR